MKRMRALAACFAVQGLLASETETFGYEGDKKESRYQQVSREAVKIADALMAELENTKPEKKP